MLLSACAALLGPSSIAHGQTPACARETAGELSVQGGVRCQCVLQREGSITGAPGGYVWDCGILRGRMNQLVPAAPDSSYQGPPIDAVVVDPNNVPEPPRNHWRLRQP